jgi:hypothetical protein
MKSTITATLCELVEGHTNARGASEEQRTRQFVEAIRLRAGVTPAQLTAAHVWEAALRNRDAAAVRLDQVQRGEIHGTLEDAEDACDAAWNAWVDADAALFNLCGEVQVEVEVMP